MRNTFKTVVSALTIILVNCHIVTSDVTLSSSPIGYHFCSDGSWISYLWKRGPIYEQVENVTIGFETLQSSGLLLKIGDPDTPDIATVVHTVAGNAYATQKFKDTTIAEVFDESVKINDNAYHEITIHHGNSFTLQVDQNPTINDTDFNNGGRGQRIGGDIDMGGSSKPYGIDFFNGTISKLIINGLNILDFDDSLFVAMTYKPTTPTNSSQRGNVDLFRNIVYVAGQFDPNRTTAGTSNDDDLIIPICTLIEENLPDPNYKTNVTIKRSTSINDECDDEDCIDGSGSGSGSGEIPYHTDYSSTSLPSTLIISMISTEPTTSIESEITDFYWVTSSTSEATPPKTTTAIEMAPVSTTTFSPTTISSTTEEYIYTKRIAPDQSSRTSTFRSTASYTTNTGDEETETEDYLSTEYPQINDDSSINFLSIQIISIIGLCVGLVLITIVLVYVIIAKRRSRKPKKATV